MPLQFAGIDTDMLPPSLLGKPYRYRKFEAPAPGKSGHAGPSAIDVAKAAWDQVVHRASLPACNAYFKSLPRHTTLKEVIDERPITLWLLVPIEGYTYDSPEVPLANTAGRDMALIPRLLEPAKGAGKQLELVCTLIHELAHVAGASTNNRIEDPHARDAEDALKKCSYMNQYNEGALGWQIRTSNAGLVRIV